MRAGLRRGHPAWVGAGRGGWLPAKPSHRTGPSGSSAGCWGLAWGWAEGEKEGSERRRRLQNNLFWVPGDLCTKLAEFKELSGRWPFAFYLVIFLGEERGRARRPSLVEGRAHIPWSGRWQWRSERGGRSCMGEKAGSGALSAPGPLHLVCGFGMEASLQGGWEELGRKPSDPRLFCSKCF